MIEDETEHDDQAAFDELGEALETLRSARSTGLSDDRSLAILDEAITDVISVRGRLIQWGNAERTDDTASTGTERRAER